jgi:hypothetical protein
MRLVRVSACLGIVVLACVPWAVGAQHAGGSAHVGGAPHASAHPVGGGVPHASVGGRPAPISPPSSGAHAQPGGWVYLRPPQPRPVWRFPQVAPGTNLGIRNFGLAPGLRRRWILQPEFDRNAERFRRLRYYQLPYFLLGAGQPVCNPFLPGYFGPQLWYDNQFSCFGTPFFGVGFYPSNFLAPDLAYEPWFENLPEDYSQRMYPSADAGSTVGSLDLTAAIAARESADSNPSIQVTQLALKDGFIFGLTDYWVEDGMFHYVTTYGGHNAIELDRIDLDKTVKLNSDRGVSFVLRERSTQPPAPK